ncbi:MAG: ferredoxin [Acidimicrobiia bacterium]|nr:ferredoxin [Acidimicrobiia bacterium]
MRIAVDTTLCTGHGRCYSLAPEVFVGDDDGYCVSVAVEVPIGLEAEALKGLRNCPERAIRVVDN